MSFIWQFWLNWAIENVGLQMWNNSLLSCCYFAVGTNRFKKFDCIADTHVCVRWSYAFYTDQLVQDQRWICKPGGYECIKTTTMSSGAVTEFLISQNWLTYTSPNRGLFFRLDQTFYTSLLAPGSSLISLCQPLDQLVQNKVRNQVGPSTEPLYSQWALT